MKRIHIYVGGRVQGVFFRHNAIIKAKEFNLKGWVKNLIDGRVEMVCEGSGSFIDKMVEWCKVGPSGAHIENIDIQWEEFRNEFDGFKIVY